MYAFVRWSETMSTAESRHLFSAPTPAAPSRQAVHFSSATDEWATPAVLFAELQSEFKFTLDVCALPANAKCERFFSPSADGLKQQWTGVCWMNPPYGRTIGRWVQKALESASEGVTVVCLIPARTDTSWWHEYVTKADETRFVRGRLRFGNATTGAPFPSAIVIFRARIERTTRWTRGVFYRRSVTRGARA
jgi:phage N-6-adenine-methyltransferase